MPVRSSILATLIAIAAGCGSAPVAPPRMPPVSTGKVRVRVFTEPSPIRMLAAAGKFAFAATDNDLERWDAAGNVLAMSVDHGLSGNRIVALAVDVDRSWTWILTDGGLGHYDSVAETYGEVPAPPPALGLDFTALTEKDQTATLAAAADGGVWLGTAHGLYNVNAAGTWTASAIKDPIVALVRDHVGWLWIATHGGLVARKPTGETVRITPADGCVVVDPRLVVELPAGHVVVIGADDQGRERLAIGIKTKWASYRTLPDAKWDAATRIGNGAILMSGDRLYQVAPGDANAVRPLARDGMRLVPLAGAPVGDWAIGLLDVQPPPGATALGAFAGQLLIGTRDLGTARYRDGDQHPHDWLRRKQMFQDAHALSVACARITDCWIATGSAQAWHWTGDSFVAGGPDQIVLAVVRDPAGPIYALHRGALEQIIHVSRIDGADWGPIDSLVLTTPGLAPEISFAKFAATGALWIGLRYRDGTQVREYGIAIVDPVTGKVAYHHTGGVRMLPIPVGVVDADVRGGVAWFATNEGVARLAAGKVKLWTESDGLRSELARAVAIAADGTVFVATGAGAGQWDGRSWQFPPALQFEVNDVIATRNGQIWMATEHGIAAWDGHKVRRVDLRRGLVENQVLDVTADQFDRVWARGPGSLTLISQ